MGQSLSSDSARTRPQKRSVETCSAGRTRSASLPTPTERNKKLLVSPLSELFLDRNDSVKDITDLKLILNSDSKAENCSA
jgi:hypothetical protein